MYGSVYFYLQKLSKIINYFSTDPQTKPVKLSQFMSIRSKVSTCNGSVENGTVNCRSFCEYFKLNGISPEIEGDNVYLNEMLSQMAVFIKKNEEFRPMDLHNK